ncbi:MAG: WecB/TagA/CpsF family glycosyltransferase [Spirochaetaceae bacterium]|nr:WecB/TagA/CpsF family glycosyltransferase [Spirochaetaceae bacterium]
MEIVKTGDLVEIERIDLLGVPIDIIAEDRFEQFVHESLKNKEFGKNIVLLSVWDLLRARRPGDYRNMVTDAALVIPISKSLLGGARFLTGKTPVRYMPFDFVVSILSFLEACEETVYLLGGKPPILRKTEKNIRETFPRLRIIGRCPGVFRKQSEETLILSIRKSAPSLLLIGQGIRGRERWLARNTASLPKGMRLWVSDMFEVFAEKRKRPSRFAFDHGLEWVGFCLKKPFFIFRVFPFIYYHFLLLVYRIKNRKQIAAKT